MKGSRNSLKMSNDKMMVCGVVVVLILVGLYFLVTNNNLLEGFDSSPMELNHITSKEFSCYCEEHFDVNLDGSALRAEVVCDVSGFFQVPHTDVGDKRITWLTYLGDISENGNVGTDLFNADLSWHSAAPWGFNNALVFKPGENTFHGFSRTKKIIGLRKVLIINFVDNWKDKHELFE